MKGSARRCIAFALVGWLSLANAPLPSTNTAQPKTEVKQAQPAPAPLPPPGPTQPVEPSELNRPCDVGQDARNSELCAQWKAADAARDAADWAQWSVVLGIFGAIGLFATLLYTRAAVLTAQQGAKDADKGLQIAKRNAKAAVALAKQSREASHSDLRAWVTIDLDLKSCGRGEDCADLTVNVSLKNIGKTPAVRVGVSVKPRVAPSSVTNGGELPALEEWPHRITSLMPGAPLEQAFGVNIPKEEIEAGIAASRKMGGEPMIVVDAIVYYHTVFDAEDAPKRLTSIRYQMFSDIQWELRKERMAWLDKTGPAEAAQVRFSRDKGAPVYLT